MCSGYSIQRKVRSQHIHYRIPARADRMMTGTEDHARNSLTTSTLSMSGRPRSRIIRPGLRVVASVSPCLTGYSGMRFIRLGFFVMIAPIMKLSRAIFFPLLLVFVLLFAQQAGATHAVRHALEDLTQQQNDKQAPLSDACEQCADYAHLGNALNVGTHNFTPLVLSDATVQHRILPVRSVHTLPAVARGPPQLQRIA